MNVMSACANALLLLAVAGCADILGIGERKRCADTKSCVESASTNDCADGSCAERICAPTKLFCRAGAVHECDRDGLGSIEVEACGTDEYCSAETKSCEETVCAASQPVCDHNVSRLCNDEGSGFGSDSAIDCTNQGMTCAGGSCQGTCAPDQTQCFNNGLQTCNAIGQYGTVVPCEDKTCVGPSGGASCEGECAPGQTQCDGNGLQSCNSSGEYAIAEPCEDQNKTCLGAPGDARCGGQCAPGQTQCDGNRLQSCNSSGEYGIAEPCEDQDKTCLGPVGSASCQGECAPENVRCAGNGLQTCDARTGEYGSVMACKSASPHCADNACGQPPSCQDLTADCGSSNESCCTSPKMPGGTYDRINDGRYEATVASFRLDKYEVTVGRWRKFAAAWDAGWRPDAEAGKHEHLNEGMGLTSSYLDGGYESGWDPSWASNVDTSDNARQVGGAFATWTESTEENESRPINYVNWYESYAFCIWDGGFLPSEAEWNYAAAGGSMQLEYPWGSTSPTCAHANFFGGNGATDYCYPAAYTRNVGTLLGNGLYEQCDLAGNVLEWNLDWYATPPSAFSAACEDCAYLPISTTYRVFRGGAFNSAVSILANSFHDGASPTSRVGSIGLRCARPP